MKQTYQTASQFDIYFGLFGFIDFLIILLFLFKFLTDRLFISFLKTFEYSFLFNQFFVYIHFC